MTTFFNNLVAITGFHSQTTETHFNSDRFAITIY